MRNFVLEKGITHTECQLFFVPAKEKWDKTMKLFKKYYLNSGEYFGHKLLTINTLINNRDVINLEELVFPEQLVSINEEVYGYLMPYVESTNLGIILKNIDVPVSKKIELLTKVGEIIQKVANVNAHININNFYLSDINENNFVVDATDNVFAVDLDSCRIGDGNLPSPSRYLQSVGNKTACKFTKYKRGANGIFLANSNSEIMCYTIMILNTIGNGQICGLKIEDFYYYLEYLKIIGFNYELLDCFATIYTNQDNKNPLEYLESIPNELGRADLKVFMHLRDKHTKKTKIS